MTSIRNKLLNCGLSSVFFNLMLFIFVVSLSGCSTYIASKQDEVLTQIDVWSAENEFGKAFETITYVKKEHPQYSDLQKRKKSLHSEANAYEEKIYKTILKQIQNKQWAQALDLIDDARAKYPEGNTIQQAEKLLLKKQQAQLDIINKNIMLERCEWMIETLPIYKSKLKTDPRNKELKANVETLESESKELASKLTELSMQAIKDKHFITARTRIDQAIALESTSKRKKIAAALKNRAQKSTNKKIKEQKITHKKKQHSILLDIEKSFKLGDLLKTRDLINSLDSTERNNPELVQLEQELDRSINYTIQSYFSEANKAYTDGDFNHAIDLWEQVLLYEPDNAIATKNIKRAQKVIDKLSTLREKQQN